MTERDDLDLEPELDDAWDDDLDDDFTAETPLAAPTATAAAQPPAAKKAPRKAVARDAGRGLGPLAACLALLATLPLAAGTFFATGGSLTSLLDFAGLTNPANWSDLSAHPANAFWIGALATILVVVLAGVAVGRRARRTARSVGEVREVLQAIGKLDLEDAKSWQNPRLQAHPQFEAFGDKVMGAYRLQQAKLSRYIGLEGELHRLGRALAQGAKVDLEGEWDNPTVGTVADEASRLLSENLRLRDELAAKERVSSDRGPDLVAGLHEARNWNSSTLDQINLQGATLERLATKFAKAAESGSRSQDATRQQARLRQVLAAIRQELAEVPARSGRATAATSGDHFERLVDRTSKIVFQIAMEVARLGAKGERLLPMTQDLEELTTELRSLAGSSGPDDEAPDPAVRALENVRGRLAEIDPPTEPEAADAPASGATVSELAPAARSAAEALVQISRGFNAQTSRLETLLDLASSVTGIDVPGGPAPSAAPDQPGNGLLVDCFDPFRGKSSQDPATVVADPFASEHSIFSPAEPGGEFSRSAIPGNDDVLGSAVAPGPFEPDTPEVPDAPPPLLEPQTPVSLTQPEPTPPLPPSPPASRRGMTTDDLPGFTSGTSYGEIDILGAAPSPSPAPIEVSRPASPMPSPERPAIESFAARDVVVDSAVDLLEETEQVYDLSEFGAVALTTPTGEDDLVHDLAEFGAVRLS